VVNNYRICSFSTSPQIYTQTFIWTDEQTSKARAAKSFHVPKEKMSTNRRKETV